MVAMASDADPEQDFCVGINSTILVNGELCRNPATVSGIDFVFRGLETRKDAAAAGGFVATPAFAAQFPGLNTLGISAARLDFAKGGLNPPHTHPRATEITFVLEGTFYVGFVDTNNTLFNATLNKGDLFVFPRGLLHFQLNVGNGNGTLISALNSQNPGIQVIGTSLFASGINEIVLEKAFFIDEKAVEYIESKFKP